MEDIQITKDTIKNDNDKDVLEHIHKITETLTESNLKQVLNETTILYVKKEMQKFKEATQNIIEKRKRLEEQNKLMQHEASDFRRNTEAFSSSLESKKQLITMLTEQIERKQNELKACQDKCTFNLATFQKEYKDIEQTYKDNHPLYLELKNAQQGSLKAEVEMKILKKKIVNLKAKVNLRRKINHALFNKSIVKFVQAIVDYRKSNATNDKVDGQLQNTSKGETKFSFDIESLSSYVNQPDIVTKVYERSSTIHDKMVLKMQARGEQIQARGEERQMQWKQHQALFSLNKLHGVSTDNTPLLQNILTNKNDFRPNVLLTKDNTSNQTSGNNEKHTFTSYEQVPLHLTKQQETLKRKQSTEAEGTPKNKKINIIDVQTFVVPKLNTTATSSNHQNTNEFTYSSHVPSFIQLTEQNKVEKTLTQVTSINQPRTQDDYKFENSFDNMSKPDLIVSPFFYKPETSEVEKISAEKNYGYSLKDNLDPYNSDVRSSSAFSNDEFINILSPNLSSIDNNDNNECNLAQPQDTFNFGQTKVDSLNTPQSNTFFSKNLFNMFS